MMDLQTAYTQLEDHLLKAIDESASDVACNDCIDGDTGTHGEWLADKCVTDSVEAINVALIALNFFIKMGTTPQSMLAGRGPESVALLAARLKGL